MHSSLRPSFKKVLTFFCFSAEIDRFNHRIICSLPFCDFFRLVVDFSQKAQLFKLESFWRLLSGWCVPIRRLRLNIPNKRDCIWGTWRPLSSLENLATNNYDDELQESRIQQKTGKCDELLLFKSFKMNAFDYFWSALR